MRTLNEELLWLREWTSPVRLKQALTRWVAWYNGHYRHSSQGYQTPEAIERYHQPGPKYSVPGRLINEEQYMNAYSPTKKGKIKIMT